jgi:SAM-dependent methyltransferase
MKVSRPVVLSLLALCMISIAACAFAQTQQNKDFQPIVGQRGKDVVWVPTPQALVDKMLDLGKVTPQDFVIDLGSGDGRTVITAAKRGAHAVGIEFNPDMVALSKKNAEAEKVTDRVNFINGDLFEADLSKATLITMFLLPEINLKLRPKLLDLKPGTRIVSNSFTMEEWEPDQTTTADKDCVSWCTAYLWIIPAKVDGAWQSAQGTIAITQEFQMISGTIKSGANAAKVMQGRMNGAQISFTAGDSQFSGTVNGNTINGTVTTGSAKTAWTATRAAK